MTLGEMIKSWREANGLSQVEAAARCPGLSRPEWSMIEQGRRWRLYPDTFDSLSAGTGIPVDRLEEGSLQQKLLNVQREVLSINRPPALASASD